MNDDVTAPGFDTSTLLRPTPRKLAGCWMEQTGQKLLLLPQVWRELVDAPAPRTKYVSVDAWHRIVDHPQSPFERLALTDEQEERAWAIRQKFTQACFPQADAGMIDRLGDALAISQALAIGLDVFVTGDVRSIDHYEVNAVAQDVLGANSPFVTTFDAALMAAHPGGEAAEHLLVMALSTVAPAAHREWDVDAAYTALGNLRDAMIGAGLRDTSRRLETRWEQAKSLADVIDAARHIAEKSNFLHFERMRSRWHTKGFVDAPECGDGQS